MFLGIDLGTSALKLLLLRGQEVVASEEVALSLSRPSALWSEQHPHEWRLALEQGLVALGARHRLAEVVAIGLSGQMHGAVLLDRAGAVIRPAILWNDGRAGRECELLRQREPRVGEITGNLVMPGFTAPKLLWLQQHEPAAFAAIDKVLLPKDYLRFVLSGAVVSDMSDAGGTLWLDVGQRCWSQAMVRASGLSLAQMPRLVEGSAPSAVVDAGFAKRFGLTPGIAIAGGGGDNAASAIGVGAVCAGQGFVSLGTSGVVFLAAAAYRPCLEQGIHTFPHAIPATWQQMAVMLSAASAFGWAVQVLGATSVQAASREVEGLSPERRRAAPLFLPYLGGERTPHNNPQASGLWFGLLHQHSRADLLYAVMEGVAFGLRQGLEAMETPGSAGGEVLALVGGGAQSDVWAQLLADVLQRPLARYHGAEAAAALGAARLAAMACGLSLEEATPALPLERLFTPLAGDVVGERYRRYLRLYPLLKAEMV